MTYERDPVIASLASRARDQVRAGLNELHASNYLAAEVFFRAGIATLESLNALLDGAAPQPLRKLAVVRASSGEEVEIEPWMAKKFGGPDDGNAA